MYMYSVARVPFLAAPRVGKGCIYMYVHVARVTFYPWRHQELVRTNSIHIHVRTSFLNVAMATCSQQVSGNFISLPSWSSHGDSEGWIESSSCVAKLLPLSVPALVGVDLEEPVYFRTVPSVSCTAVDPVSGLVQRFRTAPGRGVEWLYTKTSVCMCENRPVSSARRTGWFTHLTKH